MLNKNGQYKRKPILILLVLAFVIGGTVFNMLTFAATDGQHDVTVTIEEINAIEINGGDVTLTISSDSMEAANDTCSISYSTNSESTKKITAVLNSNYPKGITLSVTVASRSGVSQGAVRLTDSPVDVIRNLTSCMDTNQTITYTAVATVEAGTQNTTRTVTYTITDQ